MADVLRGRENLYKLIISACGKISVILSKLQHGFKEEGLRYDGYEAIAATLSKIVNTNAPCPPSASLFHVVNVGLQAEGEGARPEMIELPGLTSSKNDDRGIDMEYEPEGVRADGPSQTSIRMSADETFMSNLKLQKVGPDEEKNPSSDDIHQHILKISSQDKLPLAPREIKVHMPLAESNLEHAEKEADICIRVKNELQRFGVSQEVFAKAVVGKTQGYLSEMLKLGEKLFAPFDGSYSKGLNNFETMRRFLAKPEEERRQIYRQKADELKVERQRKRMGVWKEPATKKKRQFIPWEAKEVMDECFVGKSQSVTPTKRQELADHLNIPEQCVSDYFKNLKSRNKYSERSIPQVKEEVPDMFEGSCASQIVPYAHSSQSAMTVKATHVQSLLDSAPSNAAPLDHATAARQTPSDFGLRLPSPKSPDQEIVVSKIAALGKNISKQNKQMSNEHKPQIPKVETQTTCSPTVSSSTTVKSAPFMDMAVLDGAPLILQENTEQSFEVGQEIFVMPLDSSATTVHISPNF